MPTVPVHPTSPDFHFQKMDRFTMSKLVDDKLPISLRNMDALIDRVYDRYPLIEKRFVVGIIKKAFEVIRERLIVGDWITLAGIGNRMHLYFNRARNNTVKARVSVSTPLEIEEL